MKVPILPEGVSLTFADYFKLNAETADVLAELGCTFRVEDCALPRADLNGGRLDELKERLRETFPHVSLISEAARREFLIAPVLLEVALRTNAKIRLEHPVEVDNRLKGTLDYFIQAKHHLLVVEAKNADLTRGLTQLAVELVAVDRWLDGAAEPRLHGAVSVGDVWKFCFLDRAEKRITEDLNTYSVPTDLDEVVPILIGILNG